MITRDFDESCHIIRVKVSGDWQEREVEEHFEQLREMIAAVRAKKIPVRVLVDIRHAPRRSREIEAQIGAAKLANYQPGDRVAILTSGLEDKEHTRGFLDNVDVSAWQNELAAEQWLLIPSNRGFAS